MPRIFIDAFGNRTPFTPGGARIWLQRAGVHLSPSTDAWLPQFLASGTRAYGFLRHDQFVRDIERWLEIHSFATVFAANPLGMLRNHFFVTDDPPIPDTAAIPTYLTIVGQMVFIGSQQLCLMHDNPIDPRDAGDPALLPGIVNFTAMRANTAINRSAPPVITAAGSWWFTPVQTGCTVVILDWGGGNFSMTHLQPYYDEDYPWVLQYVLQKSPRFKTEFKKLALQTNVSSVVSASGGRPVRYILVQSNHTAETENVVVLGYRPGGAGAWQFFYQRYPRYTNHGAVLASGALEWQLWDDPWDLVGEYRGAI
jgi:hypothetical protein